ncbi:transporter [Halobacteriales archaeon QS_8_65_32]|jgi:hypothetical protein|nr:MAG: transporter [Halobacteriales archaeon QS_8_65_32]
MVHRSTWVLIIGVVLLFIPIPPFATIAGVLTILAGLVMFGIRIFRWATN